LDKPLEDPAALPHVGNSPGHFTSVADMNGHGEFDTCAGPRELLGYDRQLLVKMIRDG
jgi:hypothetical protein